MSDTGIFGPEYETAVAIIGVAGRFPGSKTIGEFWHNLQHGVESISFFSETELETAGVNLALLHHPNYVRARAILEEIELFDAAFFDIGPRQAEIMDPQHRLFLECAWETLEHAGYNPELYAGRIGVYAGAGMNTYLFHLYSNPGLIDTVGSFQTMINNDKDYLSTRVSYKLNLKGPSIAIQSACSTSLVAVHLAWQSLLAGECDMALAGGISILLPQKNGYLHQEGMILSPDGHCRAFDADAGGTVPGSGVGIVLLKRLADALADGDTIHAVIRGSAINNDGSAKAGYTAPSEVGQAQVIAEALAIAGVAAETITYVETHGTGTVLGDPIEIAALTQAFQAQTQKQHYCAIGSVKTNIGHLDTAAGSAGLIKAILALKHRQIPPSLHFEQANPKICFAGSPFFVNTTLREWATDGVPRRAGVSSFGIGGTNAHLILEEAPQIESSQETRCGYLLPISAASSSALEVATANLAQYLQHPDLNLADVAYTLQVGRKALPHRRVLVCRSREEALAGLEHGGPERVLTASAAPEQRPVAFMFSGQGSQYANMAAELYHAEPVFREHLEQCAQILRPHLGLDIREVIYPSPRTENQELRTGAVTEEVLGSRFSVLEVDQTWLAQPALFVIEYALARLWMAWGVQPQAMIGHSIGEYVAACLAGVFSLEDALRLVAIRGRLMQHLPGGAMISVPLSEQALQPFLNSKLAVAAVNGPALCVVSGPNDAIESLEQQLAQGDHAYRRLHTSHAFHSAMMEPILAPFLEQIKQVALHPPQIPYLSNLTGTWISAAEATDPQYWVDHLRRPVRFGDGLQELLPEASWLLLEVGPGNTLTTLAKQHPQRTAKQLIFASLPRVREQQSGRLYTLTTLGQLWLSGITIDWPGFHAPEARRRVPLPTYPFERRRYWIELNTRRNGQHSPSPDEPIAQAPGALATYSRPGTSIPYAAPGNEIERSLADIWQQLLGVHPIGIHDNFFELGGDSLILVQIITKVSQAGLPLTASQLFEYETIAELAAVAGTVEATPVQAEQGIVSGSVPLTSIQLQEIFDESVLVSLHHNVDAFLLESRQILDPQVVKQVVHALLVHHDALRLRYVPGESGWHQFHADPGEVPFSYLDLSALPQAECKQRFDHALGALQTSLNVTTGPLINFVLFHNGASEPDRLAIVLHNIVADGMTWRIILEDFHTAYQQLSRHDPLRLPPKTTSFKRWAEWQTEYATSAELLQEAAYWLAEPRHHVAPLPVDFPEGVNTYGSRDQVLVVLDVDETRALLQELPKKYRAQLNDVMLTAVLQVFRQWTGQRSVLIDLVGNGREPLFAGLDLSRTAGWITWVYPMLFTLEEDAHPQDALKLVQSQRESVPLGGLGHGLLYCFGPDDLARQLQALPRAQADFSYWGQFTQTFGAIESLLQFNPQLSLGDSRNPETVMPRLVEIQSLIINNSLLVIWSYSTNVHRRSTIESLAQRFLETLRAFLTAH